MALTYNKGFVRRGEKMNEEEEGRGQGIARKKERRGRGLPCKGLRTKMGKVMDED